MSTTEAKVESMMSAEPQKEHKWLQKLIGDWTFESQASMAPGAPPETWAGSETVRSLGEIWVLGEGQGDMPGGGQGTTLLTLGFDPQRKRFVGTFIASMITYLWTYDGELDESERVLTLNAEGPDFSVPGRMSNYRDVIEFKSDDHRVLSSHVQGEDGSWTQFMTANYQRKK
jgi:hypothetical protein